MRTMTMEQLPPELSAIADTTSALWKGLVGVITALGLAATFFRKHVWSFLKWFFGWWAALARFPQTLVRLEQGMMFADGVTLAERISAMGSELVMLKELYAMNIAMMRAKFDLSDTPIFHSDKHGQMLWANRSFLRITNRDLMHLVGSNWRNIVAGPDREMVVDGWATAVRDRTDFSMKFRLMNDEPEQWMLFEAVCNKDDLGNVVGFFGKLQAIPDPRTHSTAS